jgi:hypothetical protein
MLNDDDVIRVGKPFRPACYGSLYDPIPQLCAIYDDLIKVGDVPPAAHSAAFEALQWRLNPIADEIEEIIIDSIATSVEGITAQTATLARLSEGAPDDRSKRLRKKIKAAIDAIYAGAFVAAQP